MTAAVILQIVAGLGGLLTLWAKDYFSSSSVAERKKEAENEAIQQTKNNSMGDNDAITLKLDGVLDAEADSCGDAGSKSSVLESGSDNTVRRLADFGIRNG